ncbi:MAG: hypothetical protein QOH21_2142 [Acidobacteriota bacterium]|jgi:hypothetical protein|nr:hypothetical protein [Acidobacteriota bacterium]
MDIRFVVRASSAPSSPLLSGITVEVTYSRSTPDDDDDPKAAVPQSVRIDLDAELRGEARLGDAAEKRIEASVLSSDGSAVITRIVVADADDVAILTLSKDEVEAIANIPQPLPAVPASASVQRSARLIPTGSVSVNYSRSRVVVAPISDVPSLFATDAGSLLGTDGTRMAAIEITAQRLDVLTRLVWTPTHLAVDGTFTATFAQQSTLGWLWCLTGDRQVLGFIPDDLGVPGSGTLTIALPPLSPVNEPVPDPKNRCFRGVPADVTETELANNPTVYSEDPGAFCKPFSNPERILSEKSFAVIARITQPEIGALGSVKTKTIKLLNLDDDEAGTARLSRSGASAVLALPDRHKLLDRYTNLLKRLPSARRTLDAAHPVQWEDDIAQYQASTVALGHILEFRVRWRSNGYSLGTVAKTLTLAPRQTMRIQKLSWSRRERARRTETTQLRDQENDSIVRDRSYDDAVAASLSEWSSGGSSSDSEAAAGGIGFFYPPVIGGIGGGAASSHSSSHAEGGRQTTASEQQRLHDAIRRHADALRKFESTVVTEVTQEEDVTGTTEIIRNPNYAHAVTTIYYQIVRHLRVTTEFAGVRECLFVPFAIKPFDVQRAYRWRESIQAAIRSPLYSRALRYLKDVATNFTTSNIAAGPRAGQQLTYVRGSVYVNLGIERPRDGDGGGFDEQQWRPLQPLLETPSLGIFSALFAQAAAQRDRIFQTEYAPSAAAQWADRLRLLVGGRPLNADCTLASRYQFNRSVRVDFTIPATEVAGLSRQDLQQLTVAAGQSLPPGSVAHLTRLSLIYNTDRYEHAAQGRTGTNDLISPTTGAAGSAVVSLPLDDWERVDERLELRRSVDQLIEHLNEHVVYYHNAIMWKLNRDQLQMLLDGFYVPNTNKVAIASIVDREPVGIIGNCLVYRVGSAAFLGYGKVTTPQALYDVYAPDEPLSAPLHIAVPTEGLYAQTIMDECAALEEHYGNTDWALNEKEPDLGTIDPSLMLTRRAEPAGPLAPTPFPATIINLQNAPEAPAPSGLQGVLNAVTKPDSFRDMAGLAGTQANAAAALNTAAGLATSFGSQAAALELAKLAKAQDATRTADQKIASIKGAVDKGLSTPADAAKATRDVLAAMNPDSPKTPAPHEHDAITSMMDSAKQIPGSIVEANTGEGAVKVTLGGVVEEFLGSVFGGGTSARRPRPNRTVDLPDAIKRVTTFGNSTANGAWNNLPRADVVKRTIELLNNPDELNQGSNSLCGPAAFFNTWIQDDPKAFAGFTMQLYNSGAAAIGGLHIFAGEDLRHQNYMNITTRLGGTIPSTDWMVMSAIRDSENFFFDYEGTPAEDWQGGTRMGEIVSWLESTGLYANVRTTEERALSAVMALNPTVNRRVILFVDSGITGPPQPISGEKDHFLALRKPLTVRPDGTLSFTFWTWGEKKERTRAIAAADFLPLYFGAMVAEF